MLHNTSRTPNSRFAWLTPLDGQNNTNGPWLLADDDTFRIEQDPDMLTVKVSIKAFLDLIMGVLDVDAPDTCMKTEERWLSGCQRYEIRWHKQASDTSRLFIQHRSDYFARVELFIDDNLLVAYQEPVWPHLQRTLPTQIERLSIPTDCLHALQAGARYKPINQLPQRSANQDSHESADDSKAA